MSYGWDYTKMSSGWDYINMSYGWGHMNMSYGWSAFQKFITKICPSHETLP